MENLCLMKMQRSIMKKNQNTLFVPSELILALTCKSFFVPNKVRNYFTNQNPAFLFVMIIGFLFFPNPIFAKAPIQEFNSVKQHISQSVSSNFLISLDEPSASYIKPPVKEDSFKAINTYNINRVPCIPTGFHAFIQQCHWQLLLCFSPFADQCFLCYSHK